MADMGRGVEWMALGVNVSNNSNGSGNAYLALAPSATWTLAKCKAPRNVTAVTSKSLDVYLWIYVAPIILLFGLVGNLLTIAVMTRRRYAGTNVQVYMLAMAVFDTLVLITGMVPEWLMNSSIVSFRDINPTTCAIEKLFAYVTGDTAIWILCAFTVDRCVAVCLPLRRKDSCQPRHSWLICATLFAVAIAKNAHVLWTRGPEFCLTPQNITRVQKMCGYPGPQSAIFFEKFVRPWIAAVCVSLLPFTILLVCNILIIVQLMNAQRMRTAAQSSSEKSFRQTIVMCLSISFVFLFTTLPSIVLVIGRPYWKPSDDPVPRYDVTKAVINQMTYINHSINFWLYCLTGRAFRHELLAMFHFTMQGGRGAGVGAAYSQVATNNQLASVSQQSQQLLRRSNPKLTSKLEISRSRVASKESIDKL